MAFRCTRCGGELPTVAPGAASPPCPACGSAPPLPQAATLQYPAGTPPMRSAKDMPTPGDNDWATLPEGTVVGPYRLIEPLGQGGMGTVYRAVQPGLERAVAIKILPRHLARDADFVARFSREARTLAALNHPSIVAVFDLGSAGEHYYFCMEFVDGRSLRQHLRERPMTTAETLDLVPQICDALAYAHGEGVVHRDIKPENILLDKRGRVKIADFGLARLVRGDSPIEPLTRTNTVMGTVEYMAPEQRENSRDVDFRADLYSLGVVVYEMLTGHLPVGRWELPSRQTGCDVRFDDIVLRCLEHDPRQRWSGAAEIAGVISQIRGGSTPGLSVSALAPHQQSREAPSVAIGSALSGERQDAVDELTAALAPLGFVRYEKSLPATVALDRVLWRKTEDHAYLVAVSPWPALQAATGPNLTAQVNQIKAAMLNVLAQEEAPDQRLLSAMFTAFPEEVPEDVAAGMRRVVDRTGYHDITVHSATAIDPRGERVLHHRSAFAFWSMRNVCDTIYAAGKVTCERVARQRRQDTSARERPAAAGLGRLGRIEQELLSAGYSRVWWHQTHAGLEVLERTYLRPAGQETAQLVVMRDAARSGALERRWLQNQVDLLRAALHTLTPSLRYQEFLVSLCIGGRSAMAPSREQDLGRVLNFLRLDPVSIQAVAVVPEDGARTWCKSSRSPHYYGQNQTTDLLCRVLRQLPQWETSAVQIAGTVVAGAPTPALPPLSAPAEPSEVAATVAGCRAPAALEKPGPLPVEALPFTPPSGIAGEAIGSARFSDLLAESWGFASRHYRTLLGGCFLLQLIEYAPMGRLFFGPIFAAGCFLIIPALREGREPRLEDMKLGLRNFGRSVLGWLLVTFLLGLGLVCLVVPGLVLGTWWVLTQPLISETNLKITEAMRESKRLVTWRGFAAHFWMFALVYALLFATSVISALPGDIGTLVSFLGQLLLAPFVFSATAVAYVRARQVVPAAPEAKGQGAPAPPPPAAGTGEPPAPAPAPAALAAPAATRIITEAERAEVQSRRSEPRA